MKQRSKPQDDEIVAIKNAATLSGLTCWPQLSSTLCAGCVLLARTRDCPRSLFLSFYLAVKLGGVWATGTNAMCGNRTCHELAERLPRRLNFIEPNFILDRKDKILLGYAMKASGGSRGIAPLFNFGPRCTRPFNHRERTPIPAE